MTREILGAIQMTCNDLKSLNDKVKEGAHMFDPESMKSIVQKLNRDCHQLWQKMQQESKKGPIEPIDAKLKKELLDYINLLQHSSSFTQGLGDLQGKFLYTLTEIKSHLEKWSPKVGKAEQKEIL